MQIRLRAIFRLYMFHLNFLGFSSYLKISVQVSNWFKNRRQREREPPTRKDALSFGHDSSPERPLHHYPDETQLTQGDYTLFSLLSHFRDKIQIEYIEMKNSSDSKLHFESTCSIGTRSRN